MTVVLSGRSFGSLTAPIKREIAKVVNQTAEAIRADAVVRIQSGPKTGKTYRRGAVKRTVKEGGKRAGQLAAMGLKGVTADSKTTFVTGYKLHQASAPGQAPATDLGNLAGSIQTQKTGPLEAEVVVGAEYGEVLETGSIDGTLKPRPFLTPSVEAAADSFYDGLAQALSGATEVGTP